ncbi:alpha-N-acetylgalactosamine-specific lectin-like [Strongylocentrotus purpuratus]|uniref:C-type lectin domain-containing protein n=1 Tax=Strongylocentrotus purpuratus TaxID=7668 RepID=A0A7M7P4A6_STRPU|nr:alpha-N-acetylgalactosamine-specific lectin-like [Strongylocentrotus purpuratus]
MSSRKDSGDATGIRIPDPAVRSSETALNPNISPILTEFVLCLSKSAWTCPDSRCCPDSWIYFRSSCYGYFPEKVTFHQALSNCRDVITMEGQADLMSIHSQEELEFIMIFPGVSYYLWLGLYQPNEGLTEPFIWTDGSPVNYTSWVPDSQPDYSDPDENCVLMHPHLAERWQDSSCEEAMHYVCKLVFSL